MSRCGSGGAAPGERHGAAGAAFGPGSRPRTGHRPPLQCGRARRSAPGTGAGARARRDRALRRGRWPRRWPPRPVRASRSTAGPPGTATCPARTWPGVRPAPAAAAPAAAGRRLGARGTGPRRAASTWCMRRRCSRPPRGRARWWSRCTTRCPGPTPRRSPRAACRGTGGWPSASAGTRGRGRRPDPGRGRRELAGHVALRRAEVVVGEGVSGELALPGRTPPRGRPRLGLPGGGYLLTLATLEPRKGLDVLIAALARARRARPAAAGGRPAGLGRGGPGRPGAPRGARRGAGARARPALRRRPGRGAGPRDRAGGAQPGRGLRAARARGDGGRGRRS